MAVYLDQGWRGWQNNSSSWIGTTNNTSAVVYPFTIHAQPALPAVLESPAADLGDREWLDAQIAEVCELAAA